MSILSKAVPSSARRWLRSHGGPLGSIVGVRTEKPEFVLTYDDGPEPGGTEAILDALSTRKAHATFFVLMTRVRTHRSLLADVVAEGHEVALHGMDHRAISRMAHREVLERTRRGRSELESAIGRPVRWMRPPYGLQSLTSFRAVRAAGVEPVLWGPTAWDSRRATDEQRLDRVMRGAGRGVVVLSHDGYAEESDGGRGGNRPDVDRGKLAGLILDAYAGLGLSATSLDRALQSGSAVRGLWFKR